MITAELKKWVSIFLVLVLSAFIIPYYFLGKITSVYGAFLFWNIFALVAIILIYIVAGKWEDN